MMAVLVSLITNRSDDPVLTLSCRVFGANHGDRYGQENLDDLRRLLRRL